jgi:hypothetical protein
MKTLLELFAKYQWLEERIGRGLPIPISKERQQVYARRLRRRRSAHIAELPLFRQELETMCFLLHEYLLVSKVPVTLVLKATAAIERMRVWTGILLTLSNVYNSRTVLFSSKDAKSITGNQARSALHRVS